MHFFGGSFFPLVFLTRECETCRSGSYGQKVAPARADLCIFILLSVLLMIDERAEKGRKEEKSSLSV